MANTLNINRNVDDVFYRYKMPRLVAKVEGKGNGIKTVIVNMSAIAKALSRPPTYPTKYFGCELGAQTQFDDKNERYIVNGEHDASKLQDLLDGFIRKWVLCPGCDNPETNLAIKSLGGKKHEIRQSCMACGHSSVLGQKHRVATFIIKNPPPDNEKVEMAMKAQSGRGKAGAAVEENGGDGGDEVGMGELDDESGSPTKGGSGGGSDADGADEEDWGTADSHNAVKEVEMTDAMRKLVMDHDAELPIAERLDKFHQFVQSKKADGGIETIDGKKVVLEAERLEIDKEKAALVTCRALFTKDVLVEIPKAKNVLLHLTTKNKKAQKYVIGAIEQLVHGEHKQVLMPKVVHILKELYDNDICEEEAICEWAKKPSKKFVDKEQCKEVIEKAEKFITWLETAESESETEDEDEEEEEEEESAPPAKPMMNGMLNGRHAAAAAATTVNSGGKRGGEEEDGDDDLDIDDI